MRAFDPNGEARGVLRSAVAEYGPQVLSSVMLLEGLCADGLPDWPREASLITSAARADVASMIQQQAGTVGPDNAVRLTATMLADTRSYDPAACIWVVSEFARILGYQVSPGLQPTSAGDITPPVTRPRPDGGWSDETISPDPVPPPQRGRPRWQLATGLGAVAAVALLYVGVAAAASLPPFSHKPTPPHPGPTSPAPRPTADPATSSHSGGSYDQILFNLIPSTVNNGSNCQAVTPASSVVGANAEVSCSSPANVPVSHINYYYYTDPAELDDEYRTILGAVGATEGKGFCYDNGWEFDPPCETTYGQPGHPSGEGRMVEADFRGTAYLDFTVIPNKLLVDIHGLSGNGSSVGDNGISMVDWWKQYPWPWIAGG